MSSCLEEYLSEFSYSTDGKVYNRYGRQVGSYTRKYARLHTKFGTLSLSRVLWWMHYGRWPEGEIDHIDGDTHNNSLDNLRECSRDENAKNRRAYSSNTSGYKGVYPIRYKGEVVKFCAKIQSDNRSYYLGSFDTAEEAAVAYDEAAKKLHGNYSTLNNIKGD